MISNRKNAEILFDYYINGVNPFDKFYYRNIENRWQQRVLGLHIEVFGRKQTDFGKAFARLEHAGEDTKDLLQEAKAPFEKESQELYNSLCKMKRDVETELKNFAETYVPEKLTEKYLLKTTYAGSYSTQGYSADKYNKHSLLRQYILLELLGFEPEIKELRDKESFCSYQLYGHISSFDYWMLEHGGKFISVLNWATLCWQNGVNPRVYFPYLSREDVAKSEKLAFERKYSVTLDNMMLELSEEEIEKLPGKYK